MRGGHFPSSRRASSAHRGELSREAHVVDVGEPPSETPKDLAPRLEVQTLAIRADCEFAALIEAELTTQLDRDDEAALRAETDRSAIRAMRPG